MSALSKRLLSGFALLCTAGTASTAAVCPAQQLLHTAQSTAARLTRCPSTADDLVSETAFKLLNRNHRDIEVPGDRRDAYVRKCVENTYRDDRRKHRKVRPTTELSDEENKILETSLISSRNPCQDAEIEEFRSQLTAQDAEVLQLLEQGHKTRQIASLMNRTRHTVRASLSRIRVLASKYFLESEAPLEGDGRLSLKPPYSNPA